MKCLDAMWAFDVCNWSSKKGGSILTERVSGTSMEEEVSGWVKYGRC